MPVQVRVDRQGRVIIPLRERERLGLEEGGILDLVATPEGILLERRRAATVRMGDDGVPLIIVEGLDQVSNEESLDAIRRHRARE
jgi:AbrB family looped-hinge helix DNA binding protein